jgi:hypothetical protein
MKIFLISLFTVVVVSMVSVMGQVPNELVVAKDYAQTPRMTINGKTVTGDDVFKELIVLSKRQGHETPVSVILPETLRFVDWTNVRKLLETVGFTHIKYFVRWNSTGKMIELQQVGSATETNRSTASAPPK